jgi:hypothetical protein
MPSKRTDASALAVIASLALTGLAGCVASPSPPPQLPSADEALAIQSRVIDCEWKAANRFDDGRAPVADVAQRILGVCAVELTKARLAFRLSPADAELDEFKMAVESVEQARKSRRGRS